MDNTQHFTTPSNNLITLIKLHWFKLIVAGLIIFIFTNKEFSFEFNIQSPENTKEKTSKSQLPAPSEKPREVFTEQVASTSGVRQKLGLILGEDTKIPSLKFELQKVDRNTKIAYLKRFARVAIAERKKFGIPSAITLGNAILNSAAGENNITQRTNNHFGISCSNGWSLSTETVDGTCFRKYENAWMSFRDHSQFITSGSFASLQNIPYQDYKAWAKGLQAAGFSDKPNYAQELLDIIEQYSLHELDLK